MNMFLFLLSFPAAVGVWYFLAKKMKATGKGLSRHVTGFFAGFFAWLAVCTIAVYSDPKARDDLAKKNAEAVAAEKLSAQKIIESAPSPEKSAEFAPISKNITEAGQSPANSNEQILPKTAVMNLDFKTYYKYVEADFKGYQIPYKLPPLSYLTADADGGKSISYPLNASKLMLIVHTDSNEKIKEIRVILRPEGGSIEVENSIIAANLLISATEGSNGDKTMGKDVAYQIPNLIQEYNKNQKDERAGVRDFTRNNIRYKIAVANASVLLLAKAE